LSVLALGAVPNPILFTETQYFHFGAKRLFV